MKTSNIVEKVKAKLNKTAADMEFKTKGVELHYFHDMAEKKYMETLKEKWGLKEIDRTELDWDWDDVEVKWYVNFPRSSQVLNIQIIVPDQLLAVSGKVDYLDENDKEHSFDFDDDFEVKGLEADYKDLKIHGADIAPFEINWETKEVRFS